MSEREKRLEEALREIEGIADGESALRETRPGPIKKAFDRITRLACEALAGGEAPRCPRCHGTGYVPEPSPGPGEWGTQMRCACNPADGAP